MLHWALEHVNAERVILHVAEWNKRAVNLYQKAGFVEVMRKNGQVVMRKEL